MVEGQAGFLFPGSSLNITTSGIINADLVVMGAKRQNASCVRSRQPRQASRYYCLIQYFVQSSGTVRTVPF